MAEAEGINEVGCNESERITTPKSSNVAEADSRVDWKATSLSIVICEMVAALSG